MLRIVCGIVAAAEKPVGSSAGFSREVQTFMKGQGRR